MTTAVTEVVTDKIVGRIPCPVCRIETALKVTKKGLVCITHNNCCQIFARSDNADQRLRDMIVKASEPAPAPSSPQAKHDKVPPAPAPDAKKKNDWNVYD